MGPMFPKTVDVGGGVYPKNTRPMQKLRPRRVETDHDRIGSWDKDKNKNRKTAKKYVNLHFEITKSAFDFHTPCL